MYVHPQALKELYSGIIKTLYDRLSNFCCFSVSNSACCRRNAKYRHGSSNEMRHWLQTNTPKVVLY